MKSLFVLALLFTASTGFSAGESLLENQGPQVGMDIVSNNNTECNKQYKDAAGATGETLESTKGSVRE